MQHFIWVFTVCQSTCLPVSIMKRVNIWHLDKTEGALTCMPVNWKPNFSTCGNLVISLAILAGPASGSYVFFPILMSTTHGFLYLETRFSSFIYVTEIKINLHNSNLLTLGMLNILYNTPPYKIWRMILNGGNKWAVFLTYAFRLQTHHKVHTSKFV